MEKDSIVMTIHVIPGSKLNQIMGYMDNGPLKIKIKAKPLGGKANKELIKFLSDILEIKESCLEITSGLSSRNKIVRICGINESILQKKISMGLR